MRRADLIFLPDSSHYVVLINETPVLSVLLGKKGLNWKRYLAEEFWDFVFSCIREQLAYPLKDNFDDFVVRTYYDLYVELKSKMGGIEATEKLSNLPTLYV